LSLSLAFGASFVQKHGLDFGQIAGMFDAIKPELFDVP